MPERRIRGIAFAIFLLVYLPLDAQQKYEKESRLHENEVPEDARHFVEALEIKGKTKWYLEEGLDRSSIEAKFKFNKQKYSIEFDPAGNLEDIEIQVKWTRLPSVIRDSINFHLGKICSKYKIRKAQLQYSGNPEVLLAKIKKGLDSKEFLTRYEIIARCKSANGLFLYEYLFSEEGSLRTVSQIIFQNSSNLEY